jgi:NitT/TauT family transport system substrate-binding protein
MRTIQDRRHFLAGLSAAGAAGLVGTRPTLADEGPPEVTTIRLRVEDNVSNIVNGTPEKTTCVAPIYITEDLLRTEGFTDIRYVLVKSGPPLTQAFATGDIDFALMFAPGVVTRLDAGVPITVLAGVHPGCMNLFAQEPVRTFSDLKGKRIGINEQLGSTDYLFISIMATHVGLDPKKDFQWVTIDQVDRPIELFVQGKIDAYLAFVSEFPELGARKGSHVIVDMALDQPWSQYFCCILVGQRDFVRQCPVATKRALRAILKATDLCATEPERAARLLSQGGFVDHYDLALQPLTELPYNLWRELNPEDSLRFYALWQHEFGVLNSTPNKIIAEGTDWRFLNELKRELKG